MPRPKQSAALLCSVLGASLLMGCTSYRSPQTAMNMDSGAVHVAGSGVGVSRAESIDTGFFVPDGRGGHIWQSSGTRPATTPLMADAQELRLKVRELAAQLLETRSNDALNGIVALPVSFVNLNDFSETNALGRYMAESMYYEFNQRGVPVREYRMDKRITMRPDVGEFALSRNLPPLPTNQQWGAVLVGTYLREQGAIFINARLVRPADGMVLRTAQLIVANNNLAATMTAKPKPPVIKKPALSEGKLQITSSWSSGKPVTPQKRKAVRKKPATSVAKTAAAPAKVTQTAQAAPSPAPAAPPSQPAVQKPSSLDTGIPMPGVGKNI